MHSALVRSLIVLTASVACSGCSFAFIDTVPDEPERLAYFDCTSTMGLPVADGVFALSSTVGAVTVLSQSKDEFKDDNDGGSRDLAAGVNIALAAIMAASGIYGVIQTERCADAKRELRARLMPKTQRTRTHVLPPPAPPGPAVPAPPLTPPASSEPAPTPTPADSAPSTSAPAPSTSAPAPSTPAPSAPAPAPAPAPSTPAPAPSAPAPAP